MKHDNTLSTILAIIVSLSGTYLALLQSDLVFSRSYMTTIGILGRSYSQEKAWAEFFLFVAIAVTGLVILIRNYNARNKISKSD